MLNSPHIPLRECRPRELYLLTPAGGDGHPGPPSVGVFHGPLDLVTLRGGCFSLSRERHVDAPDGTASPVHPLGPLPRGIPLASSLHPVCRVCNRPLRPALAGSWEHPAPVRHSPSPRLENPTLTVFLAALRSVVGVCQAL